jgi:hypothetical protein
MSSTKIEKYLSDLSTLIDSVRTDDKSNDKAFFEGLNKHLVEQTGLANIGDVVNQYCDAYNGKINKGHLGFSSPIYLHADKIPNTDEKFVILVYSFSEKLAKIADINPYKESFGCVKAIGSFKSKEEAEEYILKNNLLSKRCNSNIRIAYNGHFNSLTAKPEADPNAKTRFVTEDKNGRKLIIDAETERMQEESMNKKELEERKHALYEFNKSCEDRKSIAYYIIVKQKHEQLLKSLKDAQSFADETNKKVQDAQKELDELDAEFPTFKNVWKSEQSKMSKTVLDVDLDKKSSFKTIDGVEGYGPSSLDKSGPSLFKPT